MRRFVDDDNGYLRWLASYPDAFVLTMKRDPEPSDPVLHRTSCRVANGSARRTPSLTRDHERLCGGRGALEEYARRELGGDATPCSRCIR